ncbi:MAG: DUF1461 domain-containing protein [Thiohalobacterales bacterium]
MKDSRNSGPAYWTGNAVLVVSGLCISLFLAWQLLSAANFLYPVLHDVTGIQKTIEEYAPKNIYKKSFDETTRAQRVELFRRIVYGINHDGDGLDSIQYSTAAGKPLGALLRPPEITHLKDVAHLLNTFRTVAYSALAVFIVMVTAFVLARLRIPEPRYLLAATALTALTTTLIIGLSGAKNIFYRVHTMVFPQGHQWFFYYEESLMTMLMKAPDIFAWIAAMWLVLALVIFYLILLLTAALLKVRSNGFAVT